MDLSSLRLALNQLDAGPQVQPTGYVTRAFGQSLRGTVPDARLGDLVAIGSTATALRAEIVGFTGDEAQLAPLGPLVGIAPRDPIVSLKKPFEIAVGDELRGRILDGLGRPLDGAGEAKAEEQRAVHAPAPSALSRPPIATPFDTGIRSIDGLCRLGLGQRVGLFAGSGVGKTTLLSQIARHSEADLTVIALVGERGREVRELLEKGLGREHLENVILICATSDEPAIVRMKSAYVATTIAEFFRDAGARVLLLMDSLTRFVRAAREVALGAGEAPARRGYPASALAALAPLVERAGQTESGSITAVYTVLVEGEDFDEPVSDEVRGLLDGHIVLRRSLAERGRYPAICPLRSLSRVMTRVAAPAAIEAAGKFREHLAAYEEKRDLVELGAYQRGSDRRLDEALRRLPDIEAFLRQEPGESSSLAETQRALRTVIDGAS